MSSTRLTPFHPVDAPARASVPPDLFRAAMSAFPTGVAIVTTTGPDGRWYGFTATSFTSVSLDPPLVLVCLATSARCHSAFAVSDRWLIHFVPYRHRALADRFATRGADKFAGDLFTPDEAGLPRLRASCWILNCTAHARHAAGDHTILIGEVTSIRTGSDRPAVHLGREYRTVCDCTK
jgi:flavin reductase ActVB